MMLDYLSDTLFWRKIKSHCAVIRLVDGLLLEATICIQTLLNVINAATVTLAGLVPMQCPAVRHRAIWAITGTGVTATVLSSAVTHPLTSGTSSARTNTGSATSEDCSNTLTGRILWIGRDRLDKCRGGLQCNLRSWSTIPCRSAVQSKVSLRDYRPISQSVNQIYRVS